MVDPKIVDFGSFMYFSALYRATDYRRFDTYAIYIADLPILMYFCPELFSMYINPMILKNTGYIL